MSCQSVFVRYFKPSVLREALALDPTKPEVEPKKRLASVVESSIPRGMTVEKYTQRPRSCAIDFPRKLCENCRTLFCFSPDGVEVPCASKLKRQICDKCQEIDLAKAILDFAGKIGDVSECSNSPN
ncbi:hypothetical protein AAVH_22735 [Aphelenchoides avenae]|nr:hypothetical protein AAVH_22735 [Aphelenchus avenae]